MEEAGNLKYDTRFDPKIFVILRKLPKNIRIRIRNKVDQAEHNPFHFYERLEGRKDYRLRVGDYRLIADICPEKRLIHITHAGHRKNVYDAKA